MKCKVLVCIGADDPGVPLEQRTAFENEMREGEVDWQMNVYGGVRNARRAYPASPPALF